MNNKLSRNVVSAIMAGNEQQAGKIFELAMAETLKTQIEDFKAAVGSRMFESADASGGEFMPVKRDFTIHAIDPAKKSDRFPEGEPVQYKTNAYSPRTAYRNAVASGHVVNKVVDAVGNEVTADAKIGINESSTVHHRKYSWGNLVTVGDIGSTVVLHPEHQEKVNALGNGESTKFKDEQGIKWNVTKNDNNLTFKSDRGTHTTKASSILSEKATLEEGMRIVSKHGDGQHTAKVYKDSDWDEYRVKFFKDGKHVGEDSDYHTDDIDDAKDTAESQIKRYGRVNESTNCPECAKKFAFNYQGFDPDVKLQDGTHGAHVFDFAHAPEKIDKFLDTVGGLPHPLGGYRTVLQESTADDVEEWKQKVKAAYPDHADKIKFKSADQGSNIDASHPDHPDRSFGVYDVAAGKGHILSEDTAVGNIDAQITAQKLSAKKQENAEESQEASKRKAPTINDVVSILGNTVSVADTSAVN